MQRKYNFIYEKLVDSDEDIIGHIAYSLYKKHKIQYIKTFKEKNNRPPTDRELSKFHDHSFLSHSIESYKLKSEEITLKFAKNTLKGIISEIENDCKRNQQKILSEIVEPIKPNIWKSILIGVISAFVFSLILAAAAFIIQWSNNPIITIKFGGQ